MDTHHETVDDAVSGGSLAELIEDLSREADTLDARLVTGPSPTATENRAVRGAAAVLARQRALALSEALDDLRAQASEMAARLRDLAAQAPEDALGRILAAALRAVPPADRVGVAPVGGALVPHAAVGDLDRLQAELNEGPAVDATRRREPVVVARVGDETAHWPVFAALAAGRGVRSVVSLPLVDRIDALGALTLYAGTPHAFGRESVHVVSVFAAHVARRLTSRSGASDDPSATERAT